jgi:hypothetical protein
MNFTVVLLVANAVVVVGARLITGDTSYPLWQQVLAVVTGVAWAWGPLPPLGRKEKLTLASVAVAAPMLALALTARQLFVLQGSAMFGATGLRGFVTGRIRVKGRVGPEREHTGMKAYLWAAFYIFLAVMIAGLR